MEQFPRPGGEPPGLFSTELANSVTHGIGIGGIDGGLSGNASDPIGQFGSDGAVLDFFAERFGVRAPWLSSAESRAAESAV